MAALTSRIELEAKDPAAPHGPEDFLSTSLGVIFPDDVTNQHGDAEHSLAYTSPHMPGPPLRFELADPEGEEDRRLFSHYLWNASLLLAELMERDSLGLEPGYAGLGAGTSFDVRGLRTLEVGAGTALPSVLAGVLGARGVVATDYPAESVLSALRANMERNLGAREGVRCSFEVAAHAWGERLDEGFAEENARAFDRVLVADCLWMPWQHANLRRSVAHFLAEGDAARAWVVAGFHTGRDKMRGFFEEAALRDDGLEVERIWEVDCEGRERAWEEHREEDIAMRKRWLVVAVLKRR